MVKSYATDTNVLIQAPDATITYAAETAGQ